MTASHTSGRPSFILLPLGGRRFALPAEKVAELAPPVRLHTFPHTSAMVTGVLVRRGRIIPVYDVERVLIGSKTPGRRFYLVASRRFESAEELSAIPVNGECELRSAEAQPAPEGYAPYVSGLLSLKDETVEVLDLEKLLSAFSPSDKGGVGGGSGASK